MVTNDRRLALEIKVRDHEYGKGVAWTYQQYLQRRGDDTGHEYRVEDCFANRKKELVVFRVEGIGEEGDWYIGCNEKIDERIGGLEHLQGEVNRMLNAVGNFQAEDYEMLQGFWKKLEERIRVLVGGVPYEAD